MTKYFTIPFFVLHKGCPNQCIFCDQNKITGEVGVTPERVAGTIEKYLKTMAVQDAHIEVGFFGGTFTGLSMREQEEFLDKVQPFIEKGLVSGIRLSTRPDFIDKEILTFLNKKRVTCIELGVQSMSDEVLSLAKRGYTAKEVETASGMILDEEFSLGHQMMVGLPGSTFRDELFTAEKAKKLGASQVRIYPVIVIEGTELADLWKKNKYVPLSEDEAVERCGKLILYFESEGIKIIRCGLHPSEGLLDGSEYLAGPFHPSIRQKAESRIFGLMLDHILEEIKDEVMSIAFNPKDEAPFYGFERSNKARIEKLVGVDREKIQKNREVHPGCLKITKKNKEWVLTREMIFKSVIPSERSESRNPG